MKHAVLNAWEFAQSLLRIRGQAMAGLFTLVIIGLSVYVTVTKSDIPGGVQAVYLTFVGAYGMNKTVELFQPKAKIKKEEGD